MAWSPGSTSWLAGPSSRGPPLGLTPSPVGAQCQPAARPLRGLHPKSAFPAASQDPTLPCPQREGAPLQLGYPSGAWKGDRAVSESTSAQCWQAQLSRLASACALSLCHPQGWWRMPGHTGAGTRGHGKAVGRARRDGARWTPCPPWELRSGGAVPPADSYHTPRALRLREAYAERRHVQGGVHGERRPGQEGHLHGAQRHVAGRA